MSETDLSRAIRQALTAKGCWVIRQQAGVMRGSHNGKPWAVRMGEPGVPDLMVMFDGKEFLGSSYSKFGFIEVKMPKGKLTEAQEKWHAKAAKRGIRCAVARGVGEAVKIVDEWRKS